MINYKKFIFNDFDSDVWTTLSRSKLPILIYGMGNGADKIINVFEKYGIEYQDVFASDGFVRGHFYKGKRVISYSEACEKYKDGFDIVVSFGSKLPDVIERIYSLEEKHNVYAPDVEVCGNELFCEEFFNLHLDEICRARECFEDELSKNVFDNIIRYKLSGRLSYLKATAFSDTECDSLLSLGKYESYLDLGAYNGDTIKKYLSLCNNLKEIYAFEPDKRNFKKLCAYCEQINDIKITPLNYAVYSSNTSLFFSASGNRNSTAVSNGSYEHKTIEIEAKAPDSILDKIDFIKYDVEGLEYHALLGSKKLIAKCQPDLLVSMYHKSEDTFKLPLLIKELNPNYSIYLRRLPYIPAWDLNLYAIKKG
ncbi:MAG: FkbM family methyltransferase [Clostridia bacterium]|nr:FkbM family methyltransferase [Clostridia bacterium]